MSNSTPLNETAENTWHAQTSAIKADLNAGRVLDFNGLSDMGKQVALNLKNEGVATFEMRHGRQAVRKASFLVRWLSIA
jgi:hypothetical protein